MNYLKVLTPPDQQHAAMACLRKLFTGDHSEVFITSIVENSFVQIDWEKGPEPIEIASQLTEAVPSAVIECKSINGIDLFSRFFNGSQLW